MLARFFNALFTKQRMSQTAWSVVAIFLLAIFAGFVCYPTAWNKPADWLNAQKNKSAVFKTIPNIPQFFKLPFRLGLDLQGGTHLIYEADLSKIDKGQYTESMEGLRYIIEQRVNMFGVAEPLVQVDTVGSHYRLIVELAGIKDVSQAIKRIGETPFLEFKEEKTAQETESIINRFKSLSPEEQLNFKEDPYFASIGLDGRYLKKATLEFDSNTNMPQIGIEFNDEGAKFFEEVTGRNVGKRIAIYLDGVLKNAPTVQERISGGKAQITGSFTVNEAKEQVRYLNSGSLPVPVRLINQQTVGASLGQQSLEKSLFAGLIGILAVALFMIGWYRLPGLLAVLALIIYSGVVLMIFKLIPVILTLAGIAGFILSVGMAVDANILIFERLKEELRWGKSLGGAIDEGFKRAWTSIRDSNASSLITCLVLFWLGTSIIKGFALTLAIGIIVSMFSAIFVTRNFLKLFVSEKMEKRLWLFGIKKQRSE
ncbi:MAG TPA: protein translocase subunit SecD [Candidatus Portnoybacteria bacterium]|uniref:Protein translocase subunit SecD n=1 Tax=Candidatus Portnoybacteria bacterium CG02_land_8_20_14_3_00_45_8 TaxID=1974807 RepID=A0A2M7D5Y4_9BACT|nr:MAG: protein translocase subunit SecD [Candidatus Portnoybacteria bacterium CG02_land_8_20_14_3_00_45_8]HCX28081.1 protein translocase subunit SecD [Candidatus Portnoybacteria bacterium]